MAIWQVFYIMCTLGLDEVSVPSCPAIQFHNAGVCDHKCWNKFRGQQSSKPPSNLL